MTNTWSVWVNGIDVFNRYLSFERASKLANSYRKLYDDVYITNELDND